MNLNEVKKHVYFNLAIYIGIGICLFLSLIAILVTPVKAQEVSVNFTNSIYPGYVNNYGCNSGTTGQYCAISTGGNVNSRSFNTRYNGVLQSIEFESNFYFRNNTTYTFDIYANSNDFRNNNVTAYCYSYDNYPSQAVSVGCSYRFISKTHIQVVYPYNSHSHHFIQIVGTQVTGDTNYSLKSVYVTYDDGTQDFSGVIDNATNNTTDIINNNNSNTEIINENIFTNVQSIIKELANRCNNLVDFDWLQRGVLNNNDGSVVDNGGSIDNINKENGSFTFTNNGDWSGFTYNRFLDVSNYDLYLNFNSSALGNSLIKVVGYDNNYERVANKEYWRVSNVPLCTSSIAGICNASNVKYVRFSIETYETSSFNISYLRVNNNNNQYCPFGSTTSKLDDIGGVLGGIGDNINTTNDKIQDTYDYLTDDTQPIPDNNEISNVLGLVTVNDPLIYLTTLPITLLNKINVALNSNQCTDFNIGAFGVMGGINFGNYTFKFPCLDIGKYIGNSLWNTIDVIVGIGLLALSIYKFYHMITNILSLGAEEKASKISHYFTPMEFLSLIIEGDVPGITIRKGVINE